VIRVLVVDDHELVRAGLLELLGSTADIDVVGTAVDGEAALDVVSARLPEVVLMDLSMPGMGGIAATREILAKHPNVHVVALTSSSDSSEVLGALDAGAIGYLLKDATPNELRDGIRAAARGESPLSPKAARAVLAARGEETKGPELSLRERQVLICVARGLPNKLIARDLGISEKTVKAHLTSIFQQIGVTDRTQAALWAKEQRLADDDQGAPR
jgi:DNA-binding NarL/FixJ family response regulator